MRSQKLHPFKFLWITDPWESLAHAKDTTLRLAEEALRMGYENFICDLRSIRWVCNDIWLDANRLALNTSGIKRIAPLITARPSDFNSIHYRTDPPVDLAYLHPLQLLSLGIRNSRNTEVVNPLPVLFSMGEKTEALFFGNFAAPTVVSSQWSTLSEFARKEIKCVLKPLYQAQSKGIKLLNWSSPSNISQAKRTLRSATNGFTAPVLLQRFLPGIAEGEQRLWFLDGKCIANARKLPLPKDFRVNIDRGSKLSRSDLSSIEEKAVQVIGRYLKTKKIRLAAVDLIEGFVTDFNFTSPGLLKQIEELTGENLAKKIITALVTHSPWNP